MLHCCVLNRAEHYSSIINSLIKALFLKLRSPKSVSVGQEDVGRL